MSRNGFLPTAFAVFTVVSLSAATVEVHETCVDIGTVVWSESIQTNGLSALTLSATATPGNVFCGWLVNDQAPAWDVDSRLASLSGVLVPTGAVVKATFATQEEDGLIFNIAGDLSELECGKPVAIPIVVVSESYPSLTFSGLPAGLSFDARAMMVSGTPTTPSVNTVVVKGVNASGYRFSQTFVALVSNLSSARLSAQDDEIEIAKDEYYTANLDDIFQCDGEHTSVTLSGLPAGLVWKDSWDLLYGTPTKSGTFVVKASVAFADGKTETATARLKVVPPDPTDYDVDLSALDELNVGDRLELGDCEIGRSAEGLGVVSCSGLPTGLSAVTWDEDGEKVYGVAGLVREAGLFTVRVGVKVLVDGKVATVMTESVLSVSDTPDRYLKVVVDESSPEGSGKVSGGGALPAATGAKIAATPAKGFVFAGWRDGDGAIADVGDGFDFREPSITFGADTKFEFMELNGLFVSAEDDYMLWFEGIEDEIFSFSADEELDETFYIRSQSLPVLTVKGLPTGVAIAPDGVGGHRLRYDGETVARRPSPGRYVATITAVNKSGAKASASILIIVENLKDDRVDVQDDYGEFVPDVAIKPIDLSGAVDFDAGETLAVSGLPRGLVWNAAVNAKTGASAHTITGVPTQPGEYTLTFTAKAVASVTTNGQGRVVSTFETATATAFLTILPYPELYAEVDDDAAAAGCKVSGGGHYKSGTKVTLKATPAKGWVFAGWYGIDEDMPFANLSPSLVYKTGDDDASISAMFVQVKDDWLDVMEPAGTDNGFAAEFRVGEEIGETSATTLIADLIGTASLPSAAVSGLPAGVKFDAKSFLLSGKPTKPGVFYTTISVKNAGGYTFVRVLKLAVLDADGAVPQEAVLPNDAGIDFSLLDKLTTGVFCRSDDAYLKVGARPSDDAEVRKVAVSGVPAGLKAVATVENGVGRIAFSGTPTKPGRFTLSVTVTYSDGKSTKAQYAFIVADGGSYYLAVESCDAEMGTATGSGVYSSGATVKISAKAARKCVFTGWLDELYGEQFAPMMEFSGIDYRTATASFPFRPDDFSGDCAIYASFALSEDDGLVEIAFEGDVWEIDTESESTFGLAVDSLSLPKLTVKNLPKGVSVDPAHTGFSYSPSAATQPGIYTVLVTAQNLSGAKATSTFEIRVANRETDMISGLDSPLDGYSASVGMTFDPSHIVPVVADGVTLSVKGLPPGLSFKNGVISGIPTKVGDYTVTFTATEGSGSAKKTGVATITVHVAALPSGFVGTFNGFVYDDSNGDEKVVGTVTMTAMAAGKLSVSVKTAAGTERFSSSSWAQFVGEGIAEAEMSLKGGSSLSVEVNSTLDWRVWQLTGVYKRDEGEFLIRAQRNPFGAKTGEADARAVAESLVGTYKNEALAVSVQKTGAVRIFGKYEGRSISWSTVLYVSEDNVFVKYPYFDKILEIIEIDVIFDDSLESPQWSINGN